MCKTKTDIQRYLRIVRWARKRYTDREGYLVKNVGKVPSVFTRVENAAFDRYVWGA